MLTARPKRLGQAASSLPRSKHSPPAPGSRLTVHRAQLMAMSTEGTDAPPLSPELTKALPALATLRRDLVLRERIIALSIARLDQLPWQTVVRLTPWLYDSAAYRAHLRRCLERSAPRPQDPVWLSEHWPSALAEQNPAQKLAQVGCQHQPVRARLLHDLQLPAGTPLGERVLECAVALEGDWLGQQPYTETLRFIEHGEGSVQARGMLLRAILNRHGAWVRTPDDVHAPVAELFALAETWMRGSPGSAPGAWQGVSAAAMQAAQWCVGINGLIQAFGDGDPRHAFWRQWLRHVQGVEVVGAGVVGVCIGDWVFAEPQQNPRLCRIYDQATWQDFCRRQQASPIPLPPPHTEIRISVRQGRHGVEAFLRGRLELRPDR